MLTNLQNLYKSKYANASKTWPGRVNLNLDSELEQKSRMKNNFDFLKEQMLKFVTTVRHYSFIYGWCYFFNRVTLL